MTTQTLEVPRKNSITYTVTVTDDDGNAINITGYTIIFTVKKKVDYDDTDAKADIQKVVTSHSDPTNGITSITLTKTDTDLREGKYYYDIKFVDGSGNPKTPNEYPAAFKIKATVTNVES